MRNYLSYNQIRFRRHCTKRTNEHGFTLVELLTVLVIIGLLAAMAADSFFSAQLKAKRSIIMENMHEIQVASESYATDSGGLYGADPTSVQPYLPGGANSLGGGLGTFPDNPLSGVANQMPFTETIGTSAQIKTDRTSGSLSSPGAMGQIGYNQCDGGPSYCVTGTDYSLDRVGTNTTTLILSNQ